ncbi:hypothetical protein RB595_002777 [Gaeumannomyces hyphopodioides]
MPPERTPRGWGHVRRVSRTDPQDGANDGSPSSLSLTAGFCSKRFGIRAFEAISDSSSGSDTANRFLIEIAEAVEAARVRTARAQDAPLGTAEIAPMPARGEHPPTGYGAIPGMTSRGGFVYPAITSLPPPTLDPPSPGKVESMQKLQDFRNLVERLQHSKSSVTSSGPVDTRKQVDISEESNVTSASLLSKQSLLTAVSVPSSKASIDNGAYETAGDSKKGLVDITDVGTKVAKPKKAKGLNPAAAVFAPAKKGALSSTTARLGGSGQAQITGQPATPGISLNGAFIPGGGIPPGPLIAIIPPPVIQTPQGQLLPAAPFGVALPLNSNIIQPDISALVAMQQIVMQQAALQAQLAVAGGGMLPMLGRRPPPFAGPALPPRSGSPVKASFKPPGPAFDRPRPMPSGIPSGPTAPRPAQVPLAPAPVPVPRPVANQDLLKFDTKGNLINVPKPRGHDNPLLQLQYEAAIEWKKEHVPGYAEECRRRQNDRNDRNALRHLRQQHLTQGPNSAKRGRVHGEDVV